jgi:glycopeptide antibiotics resistance protein
MRNNPTVNRLSWVLFGVYALLLVWILLLKLGVEFSYVEKRSINLLPFASIWKLGGRVDYVEMILNLFIFVPMGVYVGMLFQRWTNWGKILMCILSSVAIECIQYIFRLGAFDATDICTNTMGAMLGLLICTVMGKFFRDDLQLQRWINIFAALGTALIIVLLVLLKLDLLPIHYR